MYILNEIVVARSVRKRCVAVPRLIYDPVMLVLARVDILSVKGDVGIRHSVFTEIPQLGKLSVLIPSNKFFAFDLRCAHPVDMAAPKADPLFMQGLPYLKIHHMIRDRPAYDRIRSVFLNIVISYDLAFYTPVYQIAAPKYICCEVFAGCIDRKTRVTHESGAAFRVHDV